MAAAAPIDPVVLAQQLRLAAEKRVDEANEKVRKIEDRLDDEEDKEKPDLDKIGRLTDRLDKAQAAFREAQTAHLEEKARHRVVTLEAEHAAERAKGDLADQRELSRLEAALVEAGQQVTQALQTYAKAVGAAAPKKRPLPPLLLEWPDSFLPSGGGGGGGGGRPRHKRQRTAAKFEPAACLSKGEYGVVYRARCASVAVPGLAHGREYAVKLGEVAAAALEDLRGVAGVVPYVKVCRVAEGADAEYAAMGGRGWLAEVMPVLARSDDALAEAVTRSGLSRDEVLVRWASHLSAALAAMHERGWVHRDIKPGNILVDAANAPLEPMLSDFGCAVREGDEVEYAGTMRFTGDRCLGKYRGGGLQKAEASDDWESLELAVLWLSGKRWREDDARPLGSESVWGSRRAEVLGLAREPCEAQRVVRRAFFDELGVPIGASVREWAACD